MSSSGKVSNFLKSWKLLLVLLVLSSCQPPPAGNPIPLPTQAQQAHLTLPDATRSLPATFTPAPAATAISEQWSVVSNQRPAASGQPPAATPHTPHPTLNIPAPYTGLTIVELAEREYGGGTIETVEVMSTNSRFTRYLVRYLSDGLTVYGFVNVPAGAGPHPLIIALHGYVEPEEYNTLDYTTRYADALAEAGYLVFHPNYRIFPPSDGGTNPYRIGFAIDVLNLIALIEQGQSELLATADDGGIRLWGHSMGGGIALRVLTVNPRIRSAVLYGSMGGDEYRNFERIIEWSDGEVGELELSTPPQFMQLISPIHHLGRVRTPVSIHHGDADGIVPVEWSTELCGLLTALLTPVECHTYAGQPHIFTGNSDALFRQRVLDFFARH